MGRPAKHYGLNSKGAWVGRYDNGSGRRIERYLIKDWELKQQASTKRERDALLMSLWAAKAPAAGEVPVKGQAGRMTNTAFEADKCAFLDYVAAEKSHGTLKDYRHVLSQLRDINDVDQLKAQWLQNGLSPHTVNKNLRAISRFENWRVKRANNQRISQGLQPLVARSWEKVEADEKTIMSFTDEQLDLIEQTIVARSLYPPDRRWEILKRAYFLLRYTGLRGSEVNSLRWSDVQLKGRDSFIFIRSHKDARGNDFNVKGNHEEVMPIAFESMIKEMSTWKRTHEYILEGHFSSAVELGRAFKRLQVELGISNGIKPLHGFRAAFCTKLFKLGAASLYVQRAMRHKSIETTNRYLDARNDGMGDYLRNLTKGL